LRWLNFKFQIPYKEPPTIIKVRGYCPQKRKYTFFESHDRDRSDAGHTAAQLLNLDPDTYEKKPRDVAKGQNPMADAFIEKRKGYLSSGKKETASAVDS
jgi:hypothetical protein